MPTYVYKCTNCGRQHSVKNGITAPLEEPLCECGDGHLIRDYKAESVYGHFRDGQKPEDTGNW